MAAPSRAAKHLANPRHSPACPMQSSPSALWSNSIMREIILDMCRQESYISPVPAHLGRRPNSVGAARAGSGACGLGSDRTLGLGRLSQTAASARFLRSGPHVTEWPARRAIRPVRGVCPWGREPHGAAFGQRNGMALSRRALRRSGFPWKRGTRDAKNRRTWAPGDRH
jgi:hypothetical protein